MPYAMAEDGMMPTWLTKYTPSTDTSLGAILICAGFYPIFSSAHSKPGGHRRVSEHAGADGGVIRAGGTESYQTAPATRPRARWCAGAWST